MRHSMPLIAAFATTATFGSGPTVGRAASPPLSAIAFMTGCWTGASSNGATIEERYSVGATLVTSQLPIGEWHEYLGGGRLRALRPRLESLS